MLDVANLRDYLRVDTTDDDAVIRDLMRSAVEIIEGQTGKTYDDDSGLWEQAVRVMVAHLYENRAAVAFGVSVAEIPLTAQMLINQIATQGSLR